MTPPAPTHIELDRARDNYALEEIDRALQERLRTRRLLVEEHEGLLAYAYQVQEQDDPELIAVKNKLIVATAEADKQSLIATAARVRLLEINAQAFEYLTDVTARLSALDEEIGEFLRRQEFKGRQSALERKLFGFRVYRARTNAVDVRYAGDEILAAHPDLENVEVEGDRLFSLVINPGVADRLLKDDSTPEDVREVLRCHRSEAFKKAPAIKIEAAKAEGGSNV